MTEYIKADSDRPDFFRVVRDSDGNRVDLEDATNVQFVMSDPSGAEHVNAPATVDAAHLGEVVYDLSASEVSEPGHYRVELRVDWADGDDQWFPTTEPGYDLHVVEPAGDRDATPQT